MVLAWWLHPQPLWTVRKKLKTAARKCLIGLMCLILEHHALPRSVSEPGMVERCLSVYGEHESVLFQQVCAINIDIFTTINMSCIISLSEAEGIVRFREDVRKIKALADENRLAIMLALQKGEKCGCVLLDELNITQPTLSHHMRVLCDSDLVVARKDGKWMYYSISPQGVAAFRDMIGSYARCSCEIANRSIKDCCTADA